MTPFYQTGRNGYFINVEIDGKCVKLDVDSIVILLLYRVGKYNIKNCELPLSQNPPSPKSQYTSSTRPSNKTSKSFFNT
jgi:hypothetical protein